MVGNALLVVAAMIWGMAFTAQRVGMDKIEPITFTASRMALSAVFVGGIALFLRLLNKRKKAAECAPKEKSKTLIGGIACGFFLAIASLLQQMGIVYTTAGKAGFITAMYILFVPVIGVLFLKKKSSLRVWIAVLLGVLGMYLLCIKESLSLTVGDSLVLLSAVMFSGHILCCDYFAPRGNPVEISAIQFVTTAIITGIFAFIFESPSVEKVISAAIPIAYCGILSGGVGYTLQIIAQKRTEPATASLLMSLESVFAVIGGVIILDEKMSLPEILGCAVIFAAIVLVELPPLKKKNK